MKNINVKWKNFLLFLLITLYFLVFYTLRAKEDNHPFKLPIIIKANKLSGMHGFPIKYYAVICFTHPDKGNKPYPIPFQFDEVNDEGNYVLENGLGYTRGTDDGYLDDNDELVVMGNDLGYKWNQKGKFPFSPMFGLSMPVFEIRFKSLTSTQKRYAYVVFDPNNNVPRSKKKYVIFDKENHFVKTSKYSYHFKKDNYLLMDKVLFGRKKVLKGAQYIYYFDGPLFFDFTFRSDEFKAYLEEWRVGPVRAILAIGMSYKAYFKEIKTSMFSEISFFLNRASFPTIIEFPIDVSRYFNRSTGIFYGLHLQDTDYKTNINYLTPPEKTKFFKNSPNKVPYLIGKKDEGFIFVRVLLGRNIIDSIYEPQLFDKNRSMTKEIINSRPWVAGVKTPIGMFFDISEAKKKKYYLDVDFYFDTKSNSKQEEYYKNYQDPLIQVFLAQ